MKKSVKVIAVCALLALGVASCKAPCGCNGHGYGEVNHTENQAEQLV